MGWLEGRSDRRGLPRPPCFARAEFLGNPHRSHLLSADVSVSLPHVRCFLGCRTLPVLCGGGLGFRLLRCWWSGRSFCLQGGDDPSPTVTVGAGAPAGEGGGGGAGVSSEAQFVTQPGYSLALPPGWEQTPPEGGAAFTAAAVDGTADATLWIERAPDLTFADFEARSLEQLRSLTGNAEVIERIPAPTDEGTVVKLRADTPEGSGVSAPYDVTLRAAGPYRYYLATTVQPGASPQASDGADLIHGSFVPEPDGAGEIATGAPPGSGEQE